MNNNKFFRYYFYVILFLGLLIGLSVSIRRYHYELEKQSVEISASLRELKQCAMHAGISIDDFLAELQKKSTLSKIVIEEDSLQDYIESGQMTLLKGSEIMNMYRVGQVNRTILYRLYKYVEIKPDYFYLLVDRKKDFNHISDYLEAEFGKKNVSQIQNYNILEVLDTREGLLSIGLGISNEKKKLIESYGFEPIIRLRNSSRLKEDIIKLKLMGFSNLSSRSLIFEGDSILGYPTQMDLLVEKLRDKQISFGIIEFNNQLGMNQLVHQLPHNVFRVHSIDFDEMQEMSATKALKRYVRAAKERSIDLLFIHPFIEKQNDLTIIDFNIGFINDLIAELETNGYSTHFSDQYPKKVYVPATLIERMVLIFVALTTILFVLSFFYYFSILKIMFFYTITMGGLYIIEMIGQSLLINKAVALLLAIIFPTLAIITQFPQNKTNHSTLMHFFHGCGYLFRILGICLIGAILIIALLSDIIFLTGIERFSGIKISFILPLILIGLFFYLRPNRIGSTFFVLKRLYYAPVRTAGLMSIFALVIFLIILIVRSGNFFMFPRFALEEQFRQFLELLFYVRPRTKEFLIGYPFLLIAFMYVDGKISRMWIWFFNILGSISLISVINSFCHLHTPLQVSFYRTILGMLLGIGCTFLYLLLYKLMSRVFQLRIN
ncbi:hypothetical protein DID74_02300 [Candidatus Marinamargulisbacteria bacterium SCGC AG-333-B06]|nr:hypothetical protein DID74_02300 [Candidatus Marinamargulisbacteria bacterium SCGC AG-333-B06]